MASERASERAVVCVCSVTLVELGREGHKTEVPLCPVQWEHGRLPTVSPHPGLTASRLAQLHGHLTSRRVWALHKDNCVRATAWSLLKGVQEHVLCCCSQCSKDASSVNATLRIPSRKHKRYSRSHIFMFIHPCCLPLTHPTPPPKPPPSSTRGRRSELDASVRRTGIEEQEKKELKEKNKYALNSNCLSASTRPSVLARPGPGPGPELKEDKKKKV